MYNSVNKQKRFCLREKFINEVSNRDNPSVNSTPKSLIRMTVF